MGSRPRTATHLNSASGTFCAKLDHGLGDVDPEDAVARVYELAGPQTATATEVDNKAIAYPVTVQDLQYARRRSEGELSVADVVDVREVLPVPPRRVAASDVISVSCKPDGGDVEQRDGFRRRPCRDHRA